MSPARRLIAAGLLACTLSCCQQQPTPPAGIYPEPDTSFIGRRLQERLTTEKADVAVIFIGGFTEQVLTHLRSVYETTPPIPCPGKQVRAFYAWDGGRGCLFWHSTRLIQRDLRAFLTANPGADLIFIGHSYGGSAIMDVLRHLNAPHGRVLVATLDPVSCRERSHPRERAAGVDYWVNAYCHPYRHFKDLAASIGGPWRECPQADANIIFSGEERDSSGRRYQHAQPGPLLKERAPGQAHSALELLTKAAQRLITSGSSSRHSTSAP